MKNSFKSSISSLFALLVLVLFSTSCSSSDIFCLKGKGNIVTQERRVSTFTALDVRGSFRVNLFQDSSIQTQEVTVSTNENIIDIIQTHIVGQSLIIDNDECYNNTEVTITVRTPALSQIVLAGSGDIVLQDTPHSNNLEIILDGSGNIRTTSNFPIITSTTCTTKLTGSGNIELNIQSTNKLNASVSGSGNIRLQGNAIENNLSISGSGNIKAFSFPVLRSKAEVTGSGNIELFATDTNLPSRAFVEAKISGSGNIFIKGNTTIESDVSGSGSVQRID